MSKDDNAEEHGIDEDYRAKFSTLLPVDQMLVKMLFTLNTGAIVAVLAFASSAIQYSIVFLIFGVIATVFFLLGVTFAVRSGFSHAEVTWKLNTTHQQLAKTHTDFQKSLKRSFYSFLFGSGLLLGMVNGAIIKEMWLDKSDVASVTSDPLNEN